MASLGNGAGAGDAAKRSQGPQTRNGHALQCLCKECCLGDLSDSEGCKQGHRLQSNPPSPPRESRPPALSPRRVPLTILTKPRTTEEAEALLKRWGAPGKLPPQFEQKFQGKEDCTRAKDEYLSTINKSAVICPKQTAGWRATWECPTVIPLCTEDCKAKQKILEQHDTTACKVPNCNDCAFLHQQRRKRKAFGLLCRSECPVARCPMRIQFHQFRGTKKPGPFGYGDYWYFNRETFNPYHLTTCTTTYKPRAKEAALSEALAETFEPGEHGKRRGTSAARVAANATFQREISKPEAERLPDEEIRRLLASESINVSQKKFDTAKDAVLSGAVSELLKKRRRLEAAHDEFVASSSTPTAHAAGGSARAPAEMAVVDPELMSTLSRHKLLGVAETLRVKGGVERMEDLQLLDEEDVAELQLAIVPRKRLLLLLHEVQTSSPLAPQALPPARPLTAAAPAPSSQ